MCVFPKWLDICKLQVCRHANDLKLQHSSGTSTSAQPAAPADWTTHHPVLYLPTTEMKTSKNSSLFLLIQRYLFIRCDFCSSDLLNNLKFILIKDKRMITLYAVPISFWPILGKENQYFYTRHPNNNDR